MSNPYNPPKSAVRDVEATKGSAIKAVALGLVADLGGSCVAAAAIFGTYGMTLIHAGATREEVEAALTHFSYYSWVGIAAVISGCLFSMLGGYVCARVANRDEYKLAALVAVISIAVSLFGGVRGYPAGLKAALALAYLVSTFVGVRLGIAKDAHGA